MKVGIVIDAWKLSIFRRHLQRDGFEFEKHGAGKTIYTLSVITSDPEALAETVKRAQAEAHRMRTSV